MGLKTLISNVLKFKDFFYATVIGLSFAHSVTALSWIDSKIWNSYSNDYFKASCYSFFKGCADIAFSDTNPIKFFLFFYLLLSILIVIPVFLKKRKLTYFLFFLLFVIKCMFFLSRYNVMGNYHTMHLALVITFLLSPLVSAYYRIALCLQYFWAGTLKLNLEWLSGAALLQYPRFFNGELYLLSLGYVVFLELVLCWGILAKNIFIRRLTLAQLIVFHGYSYFIVGSFYPLIMLGILFPILIEDFGKNSKCLNERQILFVDFWSSKYILVISFLICFCFYNLSVKFSKIDPAKDGEIRSLSLNMLDAKTICNTKLVQKFENGNLRFLNMPRLDDSIRIKCDPVVFQSYLRKLCPEVLKDPIKSKLYFHLESRRFTEPKFETIRKTWDVCEK